MSDASDPQAVFEAAVKAADAKKEARLVAAGEAFNVEQLSALAERETEVDQARARRDAAITAQVPGSAQGEAPT